MMRKFAALCSALLISTSVMAESDSEQARDALKQQLAGMQQYRADFSQEVVDNEGNLVHEAEGSLVMVRPDKLRWQTVAPDETLLIADGQSVWNIDSFVEQVTIMDQQNAVSDNPIILLTTQSEDVWDDFAIEYQDDKQSYQISPLEAGGQVLSLTLYFNDNTLTSLAMKDAQLQTSTLEFSNVDTHFTPDASLFVLDVPDSYIIDDQR